ncbi:MAG TPA: 16S rRNA (adenine(1518)-N(6)/adenine(1519)-N(6))-dimethyltransferase RsmA [Gemmatimonadaceae bacterium]
MVRDDLPRARKRLGQHFLTDPRILARIADALELTGSETVVEIGPGRGALTEHLLERARRVIAVELDRDLVPYLREKFAGRPLEVIEGDVLAQPLASLAGGEEFVLAGNVPYYITTPILFHALVPPRARRAVYLVQREVAERVVAAAGSDEYGALSVNVQALASPRIMFRVPAGAFSPPPKVESAVLRVDPRAEPAIGVEEEREFRELVQAAFGLRRKQMRRVVRTIGETTAERADAILAAAGIDPEARPETLTVQQFAALSRVTRA